MSIPKGQPMVADIFAFNRDQQRPWPHTPSHMKGWEAFGCVDKPDEIIVRQLGMVTIRKGQPTTDEDRGTEPWGPGEVKLGVAWVGIQTFADSTDSAYIQVVGTERADVEARWYAARVAFLAVSHALWPRTRAATNEGEGDG